VLAARATLAGLVCLLLAACTGGSGEPAAQAPPSGPSLRLSVIGVPLNCAAVPGAPEGCQVGGSGVANGAWQGRRLPQRPARPATTRRLP